MFQNAVFDLFQAVMVGIELLLNLLEVKVILGIGVPGQVQHVVQIGILHRVVGGLGIEAFQLSEFFLKVLLDILVPLHFVGTFLEFVDIVDVGTQFLLNRAYLLLQEVVTLLLRQLFACAGLDIGLDFD